MELQRGHVVDLPLSASVVHAKIWECCTERAQRFFLHIL
jgi:hypothetical protein